MQVKVDVLIAQFAYAGNGGVAAILPELGTWLASLTQTLSKDDRVGRVAVKRYGDIPLTMERNRVVRDAIEGKFDIIVMLDSDNVPDLYVGKKPWAKPFWDSSFEFAFQRLLRGVPTVVAAPYCGPPPHPVNGGEENVYVFYSQANRTDSGEKFHRFEAYSREHASQMRGIQEIAAGPTGCILYTTSAFELMRIDRRSDAEILAEFKAGAIDSEQCARKLRMQSYFWYEFTDGWQTRKASTEDVNNTREIAMAGQLKHGKPVVFCNWDAWAGHMKPHCVGMPEPIRMEQVSAVYQEAVLKGLKVDECIADVDFLGGQDVSAANPQAYEQAAEEVWKRPIETMPHDPKVKVVTDTTPIPAVVNPEIKGRMICGRKVESVGHVTTEADLQGLTKLAENVGKLVAQREREARPLRMLEVGSWVGESAIALLGGAPTHSRIFCVDHWEGSPTDWTCRIAKEVDVWNWFLKNTEGLIGTSVFPVKGDSVQAAHDMGDPQELDLIFLDGDREEAAVSADIKAWERHLAPGGVLCGQSYCGEFPGVVNAVEQFLSPLGLTPSRIHGTKIWFVTKSQIDPARVKQTPPLANREPVLERAERSSLDPTVAANRA